MTTIIKEYPDFLHALNTVENSEAALKFVPGFTRPLWQSRKGTYLGRESLFPLPSLLAAFTIFLLAVRFAAPFVDRERLAMERAEEWFSRLLCPPPPLAR